MQVPSSWAQPRDHLNVGLQFSGADVYVEVQYTARPEVTSDSLFFILNPMNRLDTIMAPRLLKYTSGQRPDRPFPGQVLYFNEDFEKGQEISITFRYAMDLSASNHWDSGWIELNIDKLWFPIRTDLDNEITYEVRITGFPDKWDLVSHMDASLERKEDRIEIRQVHPVEEVLILAGFGMRHRQLSEHIAFFAGSQVPDSVVQSMYHKVRKSIEFLNKTVGQEDPITEFRVVLRNTDRRELGFQFNRGNMIVTGPDFDDYGNLSHEIAHFWWSGADFIREPWMNESFANYCMFLVQEEFDPEDYRRTLERFRDKAAEAPAVLEATAFSRDSFSAYYHKGAILLKALEEQVGREDMIRILRTCISQNVHTTEGFLSLLGKQEGTQVASAFRTSLLR